MPDEGPISRYFLQLLTTADEEAIRNLYDNPPADVHPDVVNALETIRQAVADELGLGREDVMNRIMGPRVWVVGSR